MADPVLTQDGQFKYSMKAIIDDALEEWEDKADVDEAR